MKKITAIVLDVGGVLVQSKDFSKRRFWEKELHLGKGQLAKEVFEKQPGELATVGQISEEKIWQNIQTKFFLTDEEISQLHEDFYAGDRLNMDLYTYIGQIRANFTTAILSNAWLNAREVYTEKYRLDKIVDSMIISAEEGMRKPSEQIYALTLQRLQKNPDEVLFIDDDKENINAARALGIQTILVTKKINIVETIKNFLL